MDQVSKRRSKCAPDKSNPGELLGHRMNVKQAFRLKSDWPHMTSTQGTNPEMLIASNRRPLCPRTGHAPRRPRASRATPNLTDLLRPVIPHLCVMLIAAAEARLPNRDDRHERWGH